MQPSKYKIQNSTQILNFPLLHAQTFYTFRHLTFLISKGSNLPPAYIYEKDNRAESGKGHKSNFFYFQFRAYSSILL
jgi:hypothetical protein